MMIIRLNFLGILKYIPNIFLLLISLVGASFAADLQNANEITKDEWLEKINGAVPGPICKGFMEDASIAKRLEERKLSYQACVDLIPAVSDKCQKKYYDQLPAMINQESAEKWGRVLGECIGSDFAANYLYPPNSTKVTSEEH